jgi:hypothetical protein
MATGKARERLVLNLPPRQLKSYLVSTCLPAWVLAQLSQLALWNGDFWGVPGQNCESKQGGMMANPL